MLQSHTEYKTALTSPFKEHLAISVTAGIHGGQKREAGVSHDDDTTLV